MAKRKAAVNDIIYELDNEDIEVSSDDEVKEAKINRLETVICSNLNKNETTVVESCAEDIEVDKSSEETAPNTSPTNIQNGGKSSNELDHKESQISSDSQPNGDEVDCVKKTSTDCCKTTILNEDIVIDSPGNSDLGVEGCENRTPLITVRFRDNKLASSYKEQIKAFMLNLIKLHEGDNLKSDDPTDLELDIWPEDLTDDPVEKVENNLFFVDTDPGDDRDTDIPRYSQKSTVISNIPDREPTPPPIRRGPTCFNCDGDHPLRDCQKPRDFVRIANKRKSLPTRVGRYHVEDEQKFGHLIPGRISGQLRHALGLKRHEIPLHIYRMRMLGYPPGWLEEARISHSGIAMFDSLGNAILDPEEEEGQICEIGSKDKFDIKKILDFPGFNVPASQRYKEEAHSFGLPPMSEQDSKLSMLQFLAPNAMKAYKRKKLTMFPSATSNNTTLVGQAEMELDSGEEAAEFPSVPPLPDEAPPPPPPPPTCPPPPPEEPPPSEPQPPPSCPITPPQEEIKPPEPDVKSSEDDIEVIKVLKVGDIPIPMEDFIVIDEDDSEVDISKSSERTSPTLDDLEAKKKLLLDALNVAADTTSLNITVSDITEGEGDSLNNTQDIIDETAEPLSDENKVDDGKIASNEVEPVSNDTVVETIDESNGHINKTKDNVVNVGNDHAGEVDDVTNKDETVKTVDIQTEVATDIQKEIDLQQSASPDSMQDSQFIDIEESASTSRQSVETVSVQSSQTNYSQTSTEVPKTPDSRTGHVKITEFGTPVMNIASSYLKLPTDDKFAKDICDIINFENLPNSTGKYKQISALLKKVKNEVDRIQES